MAHYHPLRLLHKQPGADVVLCRDLRSHELVVVKHISVDSTMHHHSNEAAMVQKLLRLKAHPNVLQYKRVLEPEPGSDVASIAMAYCRHGDLLTHLESQPDGRFEEATALRVFKQVVDGVHFLHSHGIAHRDLSLENLLLDANCRVKICDFGLATCHASGLSRERAGKANYMAPEVTSGGAYSPVLADIWSLGIVLFILLTGSPLFAVADESDATFRVFETLGVAGILRYWNLRDIVSDATLQLLSTMLRVDATQRVESVDGILRLLVAQMRQ